MFGLLLINTTPSIPLGLYVRDFSTPDNTSVASFCPPESIKQWLRDAGRSNESDGDWFSHCHGAIPFIKEAAARAGQTVTVHDDGVSVDGQSVLPGSKPLRRVPFKDSKNLHNMPNIRGRTYRLKPGEIWAYSAKWDSLDSRYYGPVTPYQYDTAVLTQHWTHPLTPPKDIADIQK